MYQEIQDVHIEVVTVDGTLHQDVVTTEQIEVHGDVNTAVWKRYPMGTVKRIVVEVWSDFVEDVVNEVTYDLNFEHWMKKGMRLAITCDVHGIEEDERGYLAHIPGWLPCYGVRRQRQSTKVYYIPSHTIIRVEDAAEVNRLKRRQRSREWYYQNREQENARTNARYYSNHEENKRKNMEAGRRFRARQRELGNPI